MYGHWSEWTPADRLLDTMRGTAIESITIKPCFQSLSTNIMLTDDIAAARLYLATAG